MRLLWLLGRGLRSGSPVVCNALVFSLAAIGQGAPQATPWDRPAAQIAHSIAEAMGPGSARLTVENLSQISKDAVPAIRRMVEEYLKTDGVNVTNGESANTIRLTLSEDAHEGLWVAALVQGNETRVVMTPVDLAPLAGAPVAQKVLLHRDVLGRASEMQWKVAQQGERWAPELLAAAEVNGSLVVLTPDRVSVFEPSPVGWTEREHAEFGIGHGASRDPRGVVVRTSDGHGFSAFAPGVECTGGFAAATTDQAGAWSSTCHASDDPWPVAQTGQDTWIKAFYNAGRDYFTGVTTPSMGPDLPPLYSAGFLPGRPGPAMILGGVDGKVQIVEGGQLKTVAGTRDWGSDFAVVSSGCGGAHVIVSSSGDGTGDSLRAYEIPAQEAVAVSEPLTLAGTAMALWAAPDGKSALAIVRTPLQQGQRFDYEVDRVTETCN
jgi:hypothetical protein